MNIDPGYLNRDRSSGTIAPSVFLALGYIQGYRDGRGAGQMMQSPIGPVCIPQQVSVENAGHEAEPREAS